jgi:hypothetical protein
VLDDHPVGVKFSAGDPARFISGALSLGVVGLEREAYRSFPTSVAVKIA